MTAYDPNAAAATAAAAANATQTGSQYNTLPDGTYDVYGLGGLANQPIYQGVASGYAGNQRGGGLQRDQSGNSYNENIYSPAYKQMQQYVNMSQTDPNGFANLQADLYLSGHYGSGKPSFGVGGSADWNAISSAMKDWVAVEQSGVPITFEEFLSKQAAQGKANGFGTNTAAGSGGGAAAPAPIQLTDPDVLMADANSAAQGTIHRNATAAEQARFVADEHAKETAQQTGQSGGVVEPQSSLSMIAQNEITSGDNGEYQQSLQASYGDAINSLLGVK